MTGQQHSAPSGLILAGGRSRRMGGVDKAFLDLGGKPMLAHVIARLAPQVGELAISANAAPEKFAAFCLPLVEDTIADFPGPLAGILAGLRWSERHAPEASHVATTSADAPFLPADLVTRLSEATAGRPDRLSIAASASGTHPVIGLWPVKLAPEIEAALRRGERAVHSFAESVGALPVTFLSIEKGGRKVDPFFNVNTPEELDEARALLQVLADV